MRKLKGKMVETAESLGFVRLRSEFVESGRSLMIHFYNHPLGYHLALESCGNFALLLAEGEEYQCKAGAWASLFKMTPEEYGAQSLREILERRGSTPPA
jgi:hypothetical protein